MNKETPLNPSAFPVPDGHHLVEQAGMELRDYLAAKADFPWEIVISIMEMAHPDRKGTFTNGEVTQYRAALKYLEADAMLAERSKKP